MGRELHWNRTLVHRFLEGLGSASAAELVKKRPVELPGTGQLYRKNSSSSGVMFTPSSRLRKELTLAGKADKTGTTDQARALPGLVARRLKLPKVKDKTKLTSRAFASLARWIERQLAEGRPARLTKLGTFTVKRKSGHVEFRTSQHLRGQLP
jgi:nucleoid DNA-binding protein